jgi:hypothetical protein
MKLSTTRRVGAGALAAVAAALPGAIALPTDDAQADTYKVAVCKTPGGVPAPVDGWSLSLGANVLGGNNCPGGPLDVFLSTSVSHPDGAGGSWSFTAPADTTITAFSGRRDALAGAGQAYGSPVAEMHDSGGTFESTTPYTGNRTGDFAYGGVGGSFIAFRVRCSGFNGCPAESPKAHMALQRGLVTLDDSVSPVVTPGSISGSLTGDAAKSGTVALTYSATERGSGLARTLVEVDGKQVGSTIFEANGGRCAPIEGSDTYGYRVPCRLSGTDTASLDTRTLSEGSHSVRVRVADATQTNVTTVLGPQEVVVDNVALPAVVSPPFVAGDAQEGRMLTLSEGEWTNKASASVQWKRCEADGSGCVTIPGAVNPTYVLGAADVGRRLMVEMVAGNIAGETTRFGTASSPQVRPKASSVDTFTPTGAGAGSTATGTGPGGANGVGASRGAKLVGVVSNRGATVRTTFGRRVRVTGRLVDERGTPITGARLTVTATTRVARATPSTEGVATTDGSGRFVYLAAAGSSRDLTFGYRAFSEDRDLTSESKVLVLVRATGSFKLSRGKLRNGQRLGFSGRVNGGLLPRGGVVVDVQAQVCRRVGGRKRCEWRIVSSPRTSKTGRFKTSYRFTRTFTKTTYVFRVQVRQDSGWPFLGGVIGRTQKAQVRP